MRRAKSVRRGSTMIIECAGKCQAKVDAEVMGEYEVRTTTKGVPAWWFLLRCPAWGEPILAYKYDNEPAPVRCYPPRWTLDAKIPESIRQSLGEAHRCLLASAYVASVAMCRRAL